MARLTAMANFHIPKPEDRPDVEVLVDGVWCPGELRMWTQNDDDTWTGDVAYRPPGELSSYLGTFAKEDIREDTVDRSLGRS